MRIDETAPRVFSTGSGTTEKKKWSIFNPAFGAILAAFVAGLAAGSAFQSFQVGNGFHGWWRDASVAVFWFVMAFIGVVRGLSKSRS
jgi:hypothetical protein